MHAMTGSLDFGMEAVTVVSEPIKTLCENSDNMEIDIAPSLTNGKASPAEEMKMKIDNNKDESLPQDQETNGLEKCDTNGTDERNGEKNGADTRKPDSDGNDEEAVEKSVVKGTEPVNEKHEEYDMDVDKVDAQNGLDKDKTEESDEKIDDTDKDTVNEEAHSSIDTKEPSTEVKDGSESENKSHGDIFNNQEDSELDETEKSSVENQNVTIEAKEKNEEKKKDEKVQDGKMEDKEEQDADVEDKKKIIEKDANDSAINKDAPTTGDNKEIVIDDDQDSIAEEVTAKEKKVVKAASEEILVLEVEDPLAKDSKTNDDSENIDDVEKKSEKTTITFKPVIEADSDDEEMAQENDKEEIIVEDDVQSVQTNTNIGEKRKAETEENQLDNKKKQKLDNFEKTSKKFRRMRKRDLEDQLKKKIIELFIYKDEIGNLRKQCDKFKKSSENWKEQSDILTKNLKDLSTVQRKYMNEKTVANGSKQVVPTKITRSVGLMVLPPEKRVKKKLLSGVGPGPASMKRAGIQQQQQQQQQTPPPQQRHSLPQQVQKNTPPRSIQQIVQRPAVGNGQQQQYVQAGGPGAGNKAVIMNSRSPVRQVNGVHQQRVVMSTANGVTMIRPVQTSVSMTNGMTNHQAQRTMATTVNLPSRPLPQQQQQPQQQQPRNNIGPEVVDLSDDDTPAPAVKPRTYGALSVRPVQGLMQQQIRNVPQQRLLLRHPAPLPSAPRPMTYGSLKGIPPKPTLTIGRGAEGVVLKWNMQLDLLQHETVISYQIFAYQELPNSKPDTSSWKRVGDVKALPLPMACTLKQFSQGNKYHFAVRAMDSHKRVGPYSDPTCISV